jgi:RNA polymerase-interacting CarD/CdnL/TRCF family regulator
MNYHQGDVVVHHNFGVGKVDTVETKTADGELRLYYRVSFDKTTVWVPVRNPSKRVLRRITPKRDLFRYRTLLKSTPEMLDTDFYKRQDALEKRVHSGTYQGLCEAVRDLSAHADRKALTYSEKNFLRKSLDALISEWSITSGVSFDEAYNEIDGYLRKSRNLPSPA